MFTAIEKVEKSNEVSGLMEILKMCAEEKMKKWENENECRLIATLLQMKARLVEGCVLYFFELHAAEIKRVILGALASAEFEREVRKAAARHGIAVVRATLDYGNLTVSIPEA